MTGGRGHETEVVYGRQYMLMRTIKNKKGWGYVRMIIISSIVIIMIIIVIIIIVIAVIIIIIIIIMIITTITIITFRSRVGSGHVLPLSAQQARA